MNEHGKIAVRECRLAVGDRIQCDTRLRNNPFAICSRDLAVLLDSFGFQPALAHAGRCGADLVLRFERNTLCFETAMIDADIDVKFGKTGVDMIRPALAPLLDKMGSVPVAYLRAKPVFAHLAHGEHDMRVRLRSEEHTSELQSLMRITYSV